ncbi:MAG TPA: trypsin-like peptidase domain-containing protein [Phototrophicaceae bacterium]|nr:trypsin-like peptidase domain-containing protein [Phototrophicaceae bacterium]
MLKRWLGAFVVTLLLSVALVVVAQEQPVSTMDVATLPVSTTNYEMNPDELALSQVFKTVVDSAVNIGVAVADQGFGTGSGFVIDSDGHIVTNNHVVEGATAIQVTFYDGRIATAELVGRDPDSDLAVIKVDPADVGAELVPVQFADSNEAFVGQQVMAIGSPFGEDFTLTTGIVSATNRTIEGVSGFRIPSVIQTDAAINPGNSGGPLLNWGGQVIGVNSAILSGSRSASGVGFAIPANAVRQIVPYLIRDGKYTHTYLGISGGALQPEQRQMMAVPDDVNGVIVGSVVPDGPAEAAGLRGSDTEINTPFGPQPVGGDVITAIDGQPVSQVAELTAYLETNTQPGDVVSLTLWRDGQTQDVSVTLQARPSSNQTEQP